MLFPNLTSARRESLGRLFEMAKKSCEHDGRSDEVAAAAEACLEYELQVAAELVRHGARHNMDALSVCLGNASALWNDVHAWAPTDRPMSCCNCDWDGTESETVNQPGACPECQTGDLIYRVAPRKAAG